MITTVEMKQKLIEKKQNQQISELAGYKKMINGLILAKLQEEYDKEILGKKIVKKLKSKSTETKKSFRQEY